MTITIERSLLKQMIQTNIQHNQIMTQILASLEADDEWVSASKAAELTGQSADRIRYLARSGQIQSRKKGSKLIEVLTSDLSRIA